LFIPLLRPEKPPVPAADSGRPMLARS